ncbi:SusC/RagA family TonB-linked outer membrane protein [Mucilaginibacter sp. UR6-1]|uniref:SusC/RagA family TonB-linked outer membrane protein n=1 Tax=Mucilaginibacter sp. UR6-1 TaxID=1435643 RepID=UPI001E3A5804|nr:SusC/RagA family TonB-linked outer membrane protein [Mucilaginibacter sp. UR6-1]MCC8408179.1 SusC/RagA family TonB-linked outer membrane protein [Mucilaginibacter sp. UR6-1]
MKLKFLYNAVLPIRRVKYKLLLVMKLTTILLLIGTLHLSAASYSQTVSISRQNATLETVFKDIKKQTGYLFFYNGKINTKSPRLNVDLKNVTLDEALNFCLSRYNLTYTIVDKTIVVRNKAPEAGETVATAPKAKFQLSGKVIAADSKEALPGVNIAVKGNSAAWAQTNNKGEFKLMVDAGDVLTFSFIGFKTKEVTVTDGKPITVSLETQVNTVSDVVVTGYQTLKKDTYTGNAITITGDDLRKFNSQNILKGVAASDPSFRILENNLAGSNPNNLPRINIRGATALPSITDQIDRNNLSSTYNLPTFILDGFEVSLQKVTDLDINRIESVTLLKDAAATAIYGSRAANGVMVITTKAPVPGRLQLTYNYELNATAPDLSGYHVLNASEKLHYEELAGLYVSGGISGGSQDELTNQYYNKLKNVVSGVDTYWLSQPLRNTYGQKHGIYAQGGDSTFRYGVDLRYQTNPGVMKGSNRDRYSGGMSFTYNPSKKLIFRNDLTITQVNAQNSKYGDFSTYVYMNPYYPIYGDNGQMIRELANWNVNTGGQGADQYQNRPVYNPLFESTLGNFDKSSYLEIIDAMSVDWFISKSLRLKGLVSLNKTKSTADKFASPLNNEFYEQPISEIKDRGRYNYSSNDLLGIDGNVRLLYNKLMGDHAINFNLGVNVTSDDYDNKSFEARGFTNDRFTNIGFARTYTPNSAPFGSISTSRLIGSFASLNYSYKNKYLLDASYRLDGSSAFGSERRFAPFWSAGLGWNIHRESFLEGSVISRLKVTGSAGMTGSVEFPPYLSKSIYSYQSSNWYSTGIGAIVNGYGNEGLEWQRTNEYQARLELGLFNDKLVITPIYYYKLTKGLLTDINLAPSTGFSTYKENLGNMANEGYEVYLTMNAYKTKDWNVNVVGNLAHNTNKIVKIANSLKAYNQSIDDFQQNPANKLQGTPLLRYNEGQSLNTIYAVKSLGIDPENGKEIYVKKDGSLTYIYDVKDTQPVANATPTVSGNFGGNITYKQFQLSFSLYYTLGGQIYNQTLVDRVENADPRFNVDRRALEQRWVKPGDVTFYKNIADHSVTQASSRFIQKENRIELQSVYLSYDMKKEVARKIGMQTLRPSITMNDIFRASSIEIERGISYPFARNITFALLATF